jgi:hypothetical protein
MEGHCSSFPLIQVRSTPSVYFDLGKNNLPESKALVFLNSFKVAYLNHLKVIHVSVVLIT